MNIAQFFTVGLDTSVALPVDYDELLVVVSYLIASLASFAFLQYAGRIVELRDSVLRWGWLLVGALTMGGGIWAMHFIGMLAHVLPVPVSYDPLITVLSAVPAMLAAGVALHVVSRPQVTLVRLLLGGTLMGAGIGAMHYTGMAAMTLDGIVRYDPWLFAASVVVAVVLAIIALQVRFWVGRARATAGASTVVQEILSASILGFAVAAMHYTAMASTYCFAGSGPRVPGTMAHGIFATVTTLVASLVLIMAIAAVIFDRRVKIEIAARNEAKEKERLTGELLFQSQKMEAVGQLTGGVAHDFNNILMVLLAHVEALRDDERVDRHVHGRLDKMALSIERAASLIRQLMAFSRKQVLSPSETMLNELVSSTGAMLRRSLGEHIVLHEKLEAGLWSTNVDRAQLEAALINLCVNARDAMPDGGQLIIETRNVTLDERYAASHADVVAGEYVLLSVTDTGTGMSPETLRRVFEPFFTTKEVGKGTGLGLSMVYGFMHQSNGHVDISSELGEGTTVRLYFRRSQAVATAATGRKAAMPQGNERILVVEDEDAVRKLVVEELRSLGYNVVHVAHADEALDRLRSRGAFDLMLTDVMMPGRLNGKALADETAQHWPDMRVVFMSGYSENALQNDGRLDAGVRLLGKPFRKAELAVAVREALADDTPPPPEAAREGARAA